MGEKVMTLVDAYYWSQIALAGIAAVAAFGAYHQIQTFKRFELLKLLESPYAKEARQRLFIAIETLAGKNGGTLVIPHLIKN